MGVNPDPGKNANLAQVTVSIRPTDKNIRLQPEGPRIVMLDNHQCEVYFRSIADLTGMNFVLLLDPQSPDKDCPSNTNAPAGQLTDSKFQVVLKSRGFKKSSSRWFSLQPGENVNLEMMLMPNKARVDLASADWSQLKQASPAFSNLLLAGSDSEPVAAAHYASVSKNKPAAVAAFFNIATALSEFQIDDGDCLFKQYKRIVWEEKLRPDRFFAYADIRLLEIARAQEQKGKFHRVSIPWLWHHGGGPSFRQTTQSRANFQLTFHMHNRKLIDGVECVMVETDIDYYPNPLEHFFKEVLVNEALRRLTDPAKVFYLRGLEAQKEGLPPVDTPYGWAPRH